MPFVPRWLGRFVQTTTNEPFATASSTRSSLAQASRFVGLRDLHVNRDRSRELAGWDCWSIPRGLESSTTETTRTSPIVPHEAPFSCQEAYLLIHAGSVPPLFPSKRWCVVVKFRRPCDPAEGRVCNPGSFSGFVCRRERPPVRSGHDSGSIGNE